MDKKKIITMGVVALVVGFILIFSYEAMFGEKSQEEIMQEQMELIDKMMGK